MSVMGNPAAFLGTFYLGDRACKGLTIDSWGMGFLLQVDCISRIRSRSGGPGEPHHLRPAPAIPG